LAWVLNRGDDIVPIPGTKRRRYLEENVAATDIELTEEETEQIASALPEPSGMRYTEEMMRSVGR
jgi:aryl-alcohol dehydrogenase-like predicted oxidoreductase